MNLVAKALWYVEIHFAEEISLEDIAAAANVSRFHMRVPLASRPDFRSCGTSAAGG
jgi:hypothetical protein